MSTERPTKGEVVPRGRITGSAVDLDRGSVLEFFEQRGRRYRDEHPYTTVLYQDHDPQLADARDRAEKLRILSLLELTPYCRVLDLGCGIGRWADTIAPLVAHYVGVDFSPALVARARSRVRHRNADFVVGSADDLRRCGIFEHGSFDRVLISGLLLYLDDPGAARCAADALALTRPAGLIYVREPLARGLRLTLDRFWSEDLAQEYSAIYRSVEEMNAIFGGAPGSPDFTPADFVPMYEDASLVNRKETEQYFTLLRRRPAASERGECRP